MVTLHSNYTKALNFENFYQRPLCLQVASRLACVQVVISFIALLSNFVQ